MKATNQTIKYSLVVIITMLLAIAMTVFAAPFTPGQTLDPGCNPGDVDCYVETSVNIYNSDGTVEGDREVSIDGGEFYMNGAVVWGVENLNGDQFQIDGGFSLSTLIGSFLTIKGDVVLGVAPIGTLQLQTQAINNTTATNGQTLTLVDATTGEIEYQSIHELTTNWTTAERPNTPSTGYIGFNTDLTQMEYWNGSAWVQF